MIKERNTVSTNNGSEKRKSPRIPANIRVNYSTVDEFLSDFTTNINEGGLFIQTKTVLEIGTSVQLKFSLPQAKRLIEVEGEVMWTTSADGPEKNAGIGIKFQDLSEEDKEMINELVRQLRT